jgi:hypothetical protein
MNIKTVVLTAFAGFIIATTANAGNPEIRVWRDADLNIWQTYYGKPVKIENGYQYYWNLSRFEVEASFLKNGKLSCFNIEAKKGSRPLTFTEAKVFADKLGFGPYHFDDGDATWGNMGEALGVSAFFADASFHFEADHTGDSDDE